MTKEIFGANLKMMDPVSEGLNSFRELEGIVKEYGQKGISSNEDRDVIVFAPATHLEHLANLLTKIPDLNFYMGAEGCSEYSSGAHTSQISPVWLKEIGVTHVLIGHSEVRTQYEELTQDSNYIPAQIKINEIFNRQIKNAISHGLNVVYCVGETQDERSLISDVIQRQMKVGLDSLSSKDFKKLTIAYEPRWIGTGKIPTADEITYANRFIWIYSHKNGSLPIIYGGSMNPGNAKEIMSIENVCGGLIGSACLDPEEFAKIVNYQ